MKVYVPASSSDIVVLVPVPVVVVPPGVLANIQVPVAGRSLRTALPVITAHVGCIIVPVVGAVGVAGRVLITTFADAAEVHPDALVTVKVKAPAASPVMVVLVPVPVPMVVVPPGVFVNVQVPVGGKSFKTTLPVANSHVGCVIVPIVGAVGVAGWALIIKLTDATEVHPDSLVTIKLYVPASSADIVVLVPVPAVAVPPGVLVNVQVPVAGRPPKTALPVSTAHVGCVIVSIVGAGATG